MDGGALIGKGRYGCVFDPPLHVISRTDGKCTKVSQTGRAVGKVSESEDVANEINASKALSQIPKSVEYFTLVDLKHINKPCPVENQSDKTGLGNCTVIQRETMAHMLHFTMPYSGLGMSKYFTIHQRSASSSPLPIKEVITHLLEGAALLILNNYIHYDLHPGNVLFDDVTKLPRIIDFGFSFAVTDISTETLSTRWKQYTPDFPSEAPELTVIQGLRHKLSLETAIQEIVTEKSPLKTAQFILGLPMAQQAKSFRTFWKRSKSIRDADWTTFFKFYWPGFDAWGIGVIILDMYKNVSRVPVYTADPNWIGLSRRIVEILRGLLKMNPLERIDCVEALFLFHPESPILESESAMSWIRDRQKMRKPL